METIDAQIKRLETELAELKRERQRRGRRFKVGDKVHIVGVIDRIDNDEIPYCVQINAIDDDFWFAEDDLSPAT